jgi:hypothetical protein
VFLHNQKEGGGKMACFLVPMGEAIVTSIAQKTVGKEKARGWRLSWLNGMLWGGVVALAVEHALHGEIVPWPPFLTAMQNPQDTITMFYEMGVIGIPMAVAVTVVWIMMLIVTKREASPDIVKSPIGSSTS